jgi:hypothetical protein
LKIVYKHCALYCTFGREGINYFLVDLTIFEFFNLKSHLYEIFSIELEELRRDLKNTLYNNGSIKSNINISQSLHVNENFFMILDMINGTLSVVLDNGQKNFTAFNNIHLINKPIYPIIQGVIGKVNY